MFCSEKKPHHTWFAWDIFSVYFFVLTHGLHLLKDILSGSILEWSPLKDPDMKSEFYFSVILWLLTMAVLRRAALRKKHCATPALC